MPTAPILITCPDCGGLNGEGRAVLGPEGIALQEWTCRDCGHEFLAVPDDPPRPTLGARRRGRRDARRRRAR